MVIRAGEPVRARDRGGLREDRVEDVRDLEERLVVDAADAGLEVFEAIEQAGGPAALITTVKEPSMESGKAIMEASDIPLLSVTGGEAVVKGTWWRAAWRGIRGRVTPPAGRSWGTWRPAAGPAASTPRPRAWPI